MDMEQIFARVKGYCQQEQLLCAGKPLRLAAAVSGGADSVALLLVLRALQPEFGYELSVCHVHHGLRGETADRDERFVQELCTEYALPLRCFHAAEMEDCVGPPPAGASEEWARTLRYACFERLRSEGIDAIATAHTENDQAETLLFRLARGTGLHGAAGIRPKREGYLRPLLCLSRADTEALCVQAGKAWMTDETNGTDAYARNRLRHSALPVLEGVNQAAVENLSLFCEKAARADAYFTNRARQLLRQAEQTGPQRDLPAGARYALDQGSPVWKLNLLKEADPLILETAMHLLATPVRDAEEKYVALLCGLVRQGSGAVQLTKNVRFCAGQDVFWQECAQPSGEKLREQPFEPQKQTKYPLPQGEKLTVAWLEAVFPEKIQVVHKKDLKNQADYAKIATLYPAIVLRSRQPGDRFRPNAKSGSKPLRKWMNEVGIPPYKREQLPLLAAGSEVLWVCGTGFAADLAPDTNSTQILQLKIEKVEESL